MLKSSEPGTSLSIPRSTASPIAKLTYKNAWLVFGLQWRGYLMVVRTNQRCSSQAHQEMYTKSPCRKSKLFWPATITLVLRILRNSWSNWCRRRGSSSAAVVRIDSNRKGEVRDNDGTVTSVGTRTKGKNGAFCRKERSSCSASLRSIFRCSRSLGSPSTIGEILSSSFSSTCLWWSCRSWTSLSPSVIATDGRSIENSESRGERGLPQPLKGRLKRCQLKSVGN